MKKSILTSGLLFLSALAALAQDTKLTYETHGMYSRPFKKEKLIGAQQLGDILPGYPSNWITKYISVEVSASCAGKVMKGLGTDATLSAEQKRILNNADLASHLEINVKYQYKDPMSDRLENNTMHVLGTIVPETEATYSGGKQALQNYLKESGFYKTLSMAPEKFQRAGIRFTVNEAGEITNAKIDESSGDAKIDQLLLQTIHNMPKWQPAVDEKGLKVKQDFKFDAGSAGC